MTGRALSPPSLQGEVAAVIASVKGAAADEAEAFASTEREGWGASFILLPNVGFESLNEVLFGAAGDQLSPCQFFSYEVITGTLLGRGAPTQFPA